jgi:predicted PurR-regulated permease PerM
MDPLTKKSRLQVAWERGLERYDNNPSVPDAFKSDKLLSQLRSAETINRFKQAAGTTVPEGLKRLAEGLMSIVEIVLLPVLAFYFLVDGRKLKHEFIALVPRRRLTETMRMANEFNRIMRAFISSQFLLCVIAGVVVGAGLALLHVDFPITLGVLAGVTRAIPIIGPIVGGIPIVLLTLADKGPGVALAVLGFFTFLHFAESKFIMPILIGDRMELHPVIVIVVLLIGGEAGGLIIGGPLGSLLGMFFAAPVASLVKVMIRRYWLRLPHVMGIRAGGVESQKTVL